MNERLIRIGKISTVDYEAGMASVTYPEMDGNTTDKFPIFSLTGEYKMPAVGQEVLVLHLPTGQASGVILGGMWNKKNIPKKSGEHVFRKELGDEPEESYAEYDGTDGDLKFKDKNTGPVTLTELLGLNETDPHRREFGEEPGADRRTKWLKSATGAGISSFPSTRRRYCPSRISNAPCPADGQNIQS